ncbi:cyclic lactone autoinducer peptide [Paenibacillus sp. P46E]|nr:cyclic lactone autoinducer peptide [Paenibacillus sp. P46E]
MIKKLQRKTMYKLATTLLAVATILVTTTASIVYINQPEVPEELLK